MRQLLKEFSSSIQIEKSEVEGIGDVFQVNNVQKLLELRLTRLAQNKKLHFDGNFSDKIYLCFSGIYLIRCSIVFQSV